MEMVKEFKEFAMRGNVVIDFIIIAFCILLMIRAMNALKNKEAPAPATVPSTKNSPYCLSAIPLKATRCPCCTSEVRQNKSTIDFGE